MQKHKPNLFIVGAAKSATTTLYKYLEQHSEVFMPKDELYKEPGYFLEKNQRIDYKSYMNLFVDTEKYHKYIGEATTAYLTDDLSAKKIYDFNPSSKIIIILRNPVDRAYSLYNWMVQEGYEYANSFEKALELEKKRKYQSIPSFFEPEYYWNYMYFSSGLYYEQVKRYTDIYADNNILIIKSEDMFRNIIKTKQDVCEFLNIDYEEIDIVKENESKTVYRPLLSFFGRKITDQLLRFQKFGFQVNTKKERDRLVYLLQKKSKPEKIDKTLQKKLLEQYVDDIDKLEGLIGMDLTDWKQAK